MHLVDGFLNSITMYKSVLYGLFLLAFCSFIASFWGVVPLNPLLLSAHLSVLVSLCYIANLFFSKILKAPANSESYFITALILFFIIPSPIRGVEGIWVSALAAILAMASKYLFAIKRRHIFNPAAVSAVLISIFGFGASWWVATPALIPATIIISLLIVRKVRKFSLFSTFLGIVFIEIVVFSVLFFNTPLNSALSQIIFSWPVFFFAGIMLTEPLTMPPTRRLQVLYGILVGFFFAFQMPIGPLQMTPELALIVGNIFAYIVGSKQKIILKLLKIEKASSSIFNFVFEPSEKPNFQAGQYVEWTFPHRNTDSRGNRRYFTIASSPTEKNVMLGVRIEETSSSFKKALKNLESGDKLSIGSLSGDFTLPDDKTRKLLFIAGGIGVTPFRSMIKNLLDQKEKRDIVLFHSCSRGDDFVYADVFSEAEKRIGLVRHCLLSEKENAKASFKGEFGHLNNSILKRLVPDYKDRLFYISGSNVMVDATKKVLRESKVKSSQIVTDYFSGY